MQHESAEMIADGMAPVLLAAAVKEIVDEYQIRGLYTEEIDTFLKVVAGRVEDLMGQVGMDLVFSN